MQIEEGENCLRRLGDCSEAADGEMSASLRRRLRFWFFAEFDDFEAEEVFPVFQPDIEKRRIGGFHELEAAVAVFCQPAIDVGQALWKHATFLVKALVNL